MSNKTVRYALLDEIRGFMVICMILFHGFVLGFYSFDIKWCGKLYLFFEMFEPLFASGFIFLCGFCCNYSRSNLKRGIKISIVALLVTLVTYVMTFFNIDMLILFGVLHLLGVCLIAVGLLDEFLEKLPARIFATISLFLFFLTYNVSNGYIGIGKFGFVIPDALREGNRLFFLGFIDPTFSAGDYFPILPWCFAFFAGYFSAKAVCGKLPEFFIKPRLKFLSFFGKNALLFYIIHQPVWFGIFMLANLFR